VPIVAAIIVRVHNPCIEKQAHRLFLRRARKGRETMS
jgi:hypothetical protein